MLSAVGTILLRLLYDTNYETINNLMSDSNMGGRKSMSSINHIFVINGIIHETLSSTLQVLDFKQMFDSMDLKEAVAYLYDSGMTDNSIVLLYEANRNIKVKVKSSYGD